MVLVGLQFFFCFAKLWDQLAQQYKAATDVDTPTPAWARTLQRKQLVHTVKESVESGRFSTQFGEPGALQLIFDVAHGDMTKNALESILAR